MKFLQIHTFYPAYLDEFTLKNAKLATLNFNQQIDEIVKDGFAAGHMFAPYMRDVGYDSQLIIANWSLGQSQWLSENGITNVNNMHEIAKLQVEKFKPDILYLGDPIHFDSKFVRMLQWKPRLIVGWRAASIPEGTDWSELDLLLSHMSFCREKGLELGAKHVEHFIPGHPKLFTEFVSNESKKFDVVFSGQYSYEHTERNQFLIEVSKAALSSNNNFSLAYFLPVFFQNQLPENISKFNHGAAWAKEMYKALKSGKIILNAHSDVGQKNEAGNMRLFETTGVGSFLLTDYKENLSDYFEPGSEIETYKSTNELIDKITYYLSHPEKRESIALKGKERCLRDYNMEKRAHDFDLVIRKYLAIKSNEKNDKKPLIINNIINEALDKLNSEDNDIPSWKKAIDLFDQALLHSPDIIGLNYGKAVALARLGEKNSSIILLKELLAFFPEHGKAKILLAALLNDFKEEPFPVSPVTLQKNSELMNYKAYFKSQIASAKEIKLIVGSGGLFEEGWLASDFEILDISKVEDWQDYFSENSIQYIFAEHVWEHLTDSVSEKALKNCYRFLKNQGNLRIAVPDGFHPDKEYIQLVKPGGSGAGASDHKILYNYKIMKERLESAGFKVILLEYWDEDGNFHFQEWDNTKGKVRRSSRYDHRNTDGKLVYTSLIVDAMKL